MKAFNLGRMLVAPSRAESFPYIILEAAAAGIPLITTDVGGIHEIFGTRDDTGLVPPDDIPALADAIELALDDPSAARARARALGKRVATSFTVERMTRDVVSFYDAVSGAGARPARPLIDA
jgi:glycosyltransferase involved in cell wall biosynthesis